MKTTSWKRGSTEWVGWGLAANHGGGYSYRLCQLPPEGREALTEECFQNTTLKFVGDYSWLQWGKNSKYRDRIPAKRTTTGTYPEGSQWTMNPVPNCAGLQGGVSVYDVNCPGGLQFENVFPGLFGEGSTTDSEGGWEYYFQWSLMDQVWVPEDLPPGRYVLSFRWDSERTPQVWNSCSNIKIVQEREGESGTLP